VVAALSSSRRSLHVSVLVGGGAARSFVPGATIVSVIMRTVGPGSAGRNHPERTMPEPSWRATVVAWSNDHLRFVEVEHADRAARRARRRSRRARRVRRVLLMRKSWVMRQPDAFRGVIRVAGGQIDGLRRKWARWYGRWVRDVLAWTKPPSLFRNEAVAADGLDEDRPARPDEVKRLGDHPTVIRVSAGSAALEVVADGGTATCSWARIGRPSAPRSVLRPAERPRMPSIRCRNTRPRSHLTPGDRHHD
jgi:hypothetical protein